MNEAKNRLSLPFKGSSLFSGRSLFPGRIESRQSLTIVGRYPALDDINGQLHLFGYFFRYKAAIIQNGDCLLPKAFIVGLLPLNKLPLIFLTHKSNTPSIFRTTWVTYCRLPTPRGVGGLPG